MRNVYHHIAAPGPMSASLAASLKPGGRLAIVDFTPPGAEAPTPADRDEDDMHGVTPDSVRRELADAGFAVERTEAGSGRWFMVVAVRPDELTGPTTPEWFLNDSGVVHHRLRSRCAGALVGTF